MSFYSSASFFLAFAVAVVPAAALGLTERRIAPYGLAASLVMLGLLFSSSLAALASFLLFLVVASACAFATHASFARGSGSVALYRVCLALTLAPLVIYKVSVTAGPGILGFIGISYLTFKAVQVLIEIRDGLITELRPLEYLYFLVFFASFTSGPIDRSRRFAEDARRAPARADYADLLARGILLILVGAVMQLVIATFLDAFINPGHAPAGAPTVRLLQLPQGVRAIVRAYGYGLYLFFDFAGYSLMAQGASFCFGIRCPRNFRAPFVARDLKDFWNRWHITLSTWLRDFVFMRVVRTLTKRRLLKDRTQRACAGYLVNMALMGAWHGLTPDYLAYGLYHGILLAATEVYQKRCPFHKRNRDKRWYQVLSWFITLNLVILGFALFSGQVRIIVKNLLKGVIYG